MRSIVRYFSIYGDWLRALCFVLALAIRSPCPNPIQKGPVLPGAYTRYISSDKQWLFPQQSNKVCGFIVDLDLRQCLKIYSLRSSQALFDRMH